LVGEFIKHIFVRQTKDRSHILDQETVQSQFESRQASNTITWIGHMTTLINVDGYQVLTDPWWGNYGSPVPGLGPRRYAKPALAIDQLPEIDVIVVSHSHYDHLDVNAISQLPNRDRITAVVPLGVGKYFRQRGYQHVIELDWEETTEIGELRITALPAIHWSQRRLFRKNDTLWASFAIEGPSGRRIFFGGDSDHGPVHAEIAKAWGDFDLALLSIGGFHNEGVHCAPEDCVKLGTDLDAATLLPLHWGTIYLGEGPPEILATRFRDAALRQGIAEGDVWSLQIGETRVLPNPRRTQVARARGSAAR
jgi:L-ascorbate metabolism protein UlaG (beta-lactamase superfamily)